MCIVAVLPDPKALKIIHVCLLKKKTHVHKRKTENGNPSPSKPQLVQTNAASVLEVMALRFE